MTTYPFANNSMNNEKGVTRAMIYAAVVALYHANLIITQIMEFQGGGRGLKLSSRSCPSSR